MRTFMLRGFLLTLTVLLSATAGGQQSLSISDGSILGVGSDTLDVTMDSTAATEGFVLAIGIDDSLLSISDLSLAGSASSAGAELAIAEVFSDGATLGVVLDAESPFDGQTIGAGSGQLIATISLNSTTVVDSDTDSEVSFSDGTLNSPPLDNILVQGGLSIGAGQGLGLNSGTMTLLEPPPATMYTMDASAPADGFGTTGDAMVTMDNSLGPVQGFVTVVTHDPTVITLEAISLGAASTDNGAEFEISNFYENGGTLGVVMDFTTPFDGQTIPLGNGLHIATYTYSCVESNIYVEGEPAPPAATSALTLDSGALGTPPLDNVLVIGGLSLQPLLSSGTFTCEPVGVPAEDTKLWMETKFDTEEGNYAYLNQTGDLCFYYKDDDDYIQGFTFTVCYDCDLTIHEDSWEFNGSILNQVGIEYLAVQVDDDCSDGETGELIVALLMDALPPFEGQTLPQTTDLNEERLLVGKMRVTVDDTAECNEEQPIYWCNDIDGNGDVFLYNNVVIDYESIQIYERNDTFVYVVPEEIFQRGDCNSDDKVDLADSATMLANQFSGLPILCPDACDSNDDGTLNMADSVYLLNWLFKFGPIPSAPGPYEDGPDATTDDTLPVCDSDDTNC
ncbi:MAG: hypothetical protein CBC13_07105 [Planctomycetia bacterium TMED53]|nr:MAG: hypothetical protein CBC13_07105 [Planctomycetia bacterium TMED53]